jgi:hypothetical protein
LGSTAYSPGIAAGEGGQAFSFDGVGDEMRVPHSPVFDFTNGLTLSGWVRTTSTAEFAGLVDKFLQEGQTTGFQVSMSGNNGFPPNRAGILRADIGVGNAYATAFNLTAVDDGTSHHFALTCDGQQAILYVDGVAGVAASATGWVANNAADIVFGHDDPSSSRYFSGQLDEIAIYDRALGLREIQALAGKPVLDIFSTAPGLATVSWPAAASGFRLQLNETMDASGWADSPTGTNHPVTISTTSPTRFYRLIKP